MSEPGTKYPNLEQNTSMWNKTSKYGQNIPIWTKYPNLDKISQYRTKYPNLEENTSMWNKTSQYGQNIPR